ncbi:BRISC and BRCA1-A complex member 2-like [Ostrea edulis]|uniref:BRISC and BRCA1-A complex member 2-like n=1 Tax=Ostrea edulis TaxID=37623 RepID=UPI0020959111|nr:BRISC and BRCA1-A complex member 2-like [Ostrea edulis]
MQISPQFNRIVESMIVDGKFGVCNGIIRINDVKSGSSTLRKGPCGDRFKVNIPYAGQTLTWEVIMDNSCPEEPPDFIFEDSDFCPNVADIKSLLKWDIRNPHCLTEVVTELLDHYKAFHERLLEAHSRLQFEYTSLLDQTELSRDLIEVYSERSEKRIGPINFLIKLPVDFSDIPPYISKDNPGDNSAVLLIAFPSPDSSRVTPQLYLSPRVEHAFGGSSNLRIPAFPSGGCLLDYVPNVYKLLQNKVEKTVQMYDRKKDIIAAFLSQFGRSLLEFDAEGFREISFLFEWNDFFFILYVELSQSFPQEAPVLTFQSIYHESKDKPYTEIHDGYPYSPRWSSTEMVSRIKTYILDNIQTFQKQSVMSGSI